MKFKTENIRKKETKLLSQVTGQSSDSALVSILFSASTTYTIHNIKWHLSASIKWPRQYREKGPLKQSVTSTRTSSSYKKSGHKLICSYTKASVAKLMRLPLSPFSVHPSETINPKTSGCSYSRYSPSLNSLFFISVCLCVCAHACMHACVCGESVSVCMYLLSVSVCMYLLCVCQ